MKRKMNKNKLLLGTALLLTAMQANKPVSVEANVYNAQSHLKPSFLDEIPYGNLAPAMNVTPTHPQYNYYKKLAGEGREPILFLESVAGQYHYYTPDAKGLNKQYSNARSPEALYYNSPNQKFEPHKWSKQSREALYDIRKSHHYKAKAVPHTDGYQRAQLTPSKTKTETGRFAGTYGEWRDLGYTDSGGRVANPLYPSDYFGAGADTAKGRDLSKYEYAIRPWGNPSQASYSHIVRGVAFDTAMPGSPLHTVKWNAIKRMMDTFPNFKAHSSDPNYWMNRLSLQNDPTSGEAAFFIGIHNRYGMYVTVDVPATQGFLRNLSITRQRVVDAKGNVIREFTRKPTEEYGITSNQSRSLVSGEKVTIETTMVNTTQNAKSATTEHTPTIRVGFRTGTNADKAVYEVNSSTTNSLFTIKKPGAGLNVGDAHTFKQQIEVPYDSDKMSVVSEIDAIHYKSRDNTLTADSFAQLGLQVNNETGNFAQQPIQLIDAKGNVVSKPVPGEQYKLRFRAKFDAKRNATSAVSLAFNYKINRKLPQQGEDTQSKVKTLTNFKPVAGKVYSVTTDDYVVYETGVFDAQAAISLSKGNQNFNRDSSDDMQKVSYNDRYDYTMRNIQLVPQNESNTDTKNMIYLLKFDVNHEVPSHVTDHSKDVPFTINVGGVKKTVTKHIKQGLNENVSIEVEVPSNGANRDVRATIMANVEAGKNVVYESDYNNNFGSTSAKVMNEERVRPHTTTHNTNTWSQHAQIHTWSGVSKSYKGFNNGATYNFVDYTNGPVKVEKYNLNESYKINHVWFKSKTTTDLKEGPKKDGWVDLIKEPGKIKAGYGYELKLDVEYGTDAFAKLPKATATKWVRPAIARPNLPNNVYVQTPDTKIHSVNGDGKTSKALAFKRKDATDGSKTEWEFKVAPEKTLGVTTLGKFYIGEDVSNGSYNMTVFTPKTKGLLGKMTNATSVLDSPLFDMKKGLEIQVVGSATDDLNDHITQ